MDVIFMPNNLICHRILCVNILSMIMKYHTGNVYYNDVLTVCVSIFLTKRQIISIQTQNPQLYFTIIKSLRVVMLMV